MQVALSYTEQVDVLWFVAHVHDHSLLPVERKIYGFVEELSQLMRLDLMLSDTAVSQNEPAKELTRL